ncbi:MAG TPA: GNAT family N-acetyltransferase [Chroococcales cyanobacterium]
MVNTMRNVTCRSRVITDVSVKVEWFGSCLDIADELWNKCFAANLEGRFWYYALEKSGLDDQFRYFYGLITRGGMPIGIIPAFVMDVPMELVAPAWFAKLLRIGGTVFPGLPYQRTFFVGSVCSDEGTIGLLPGISLESVLEPIQQAVELKAAQVKAPMITWKDFPDSYRPGIAEIANKFGLWEMVSYPGTLIELKDGEKSSFLSGLKGSRRHNLLKKLKRSRKAVDLDVSVEPYPSPESLSEIFGLFWQTYERGKTKFEKLNLKFFQLLAEQSNTYFITLRKKDDGKMVAFMLCFKLGDRVINKFIGIDYHSPQDWYLYFRLWDAALDWVLTTGSTEFQGGQTGYRAKIDVGHSLVPLTNFCKHRNRLVNYVYRTVAQDITLSSLDDDLKVFLTAHPEAESSSTGEGASQAPASFKIEEKQLALKK